MRNLGILLLLVGCSVTEEAPTQNQQYSESRAFLSLLSGTYWRNGVALEVNPFESSFRFERPDKTFTYRFIKSLNDRSAIFEMELKYYAFYVQGNILFRTQDSAGSPEYVNPQNYLVYARRDIGSMDGESDTNTDSNIGGEDSSPDNTSGDWGFRANLFGKKFIRANYIFSPEASGNFTFHGENGAASYRFQYAVSKDTALYLYGAKWLGVRFDGQYIQTTPLVDRADYIAFHLLQNYAETTIVDAGNAFFSNIFSVGTLYERDGNIFSIPSNLRLVDISSGKIYNYIYAVSPNHAIYQDGSTLLFYGFLWENGTIYLSQNGLSSMSAGAVNFRDKVLFARQKI